MPSAATLVHSTSLYNVIGADRGFAPQMPPLYLHDMNQAKTKVTTDTYMQSHSPADLSMTPTEETQQPGLCGLFLI